MSMPMTQSTCSASMVTRLFSFGLSTAAVDVALGGVTAWQIIVGFGDDLADEATRISTAYGALLTQIHPALERILGPRAQRPCSHSSASSDPRRRSAKQDADCSLR